MGSEGSLWTRCWSFAADCRRVLRAARAYRRGEKLYFRGRYEDAIRHLEQALELAGEPRHDSPVIGVQLTTRLYGVAFLAYAAAKLQDERLAAASIGTGMARLAEMKLMIPEAVRADKFLCAWETWAQSYMRWASQRGSGDQA